MLGSPYEKQRGGGECNAARGRGNKPERAGRLPPRLGPLGLPCKSLLIPRADPLGSPRPAEAVIVDACRSLLIQRLGPLGDGGEVDNGANDRMAGAGSACAGLHPRLDPVRAAA